MSLSSRNNARDISLIRIRTCLEPGMGGEVTWTRVDWADFTDRWVYTCLSIIA